MNLTKRPKTVGIVVAIVLLGGLLLVAFPSELAVNSEADSAGLPPTDTTAQPAAAPASDYGEMLLEMTVSVALVCLLAYAILRWGLGRLAGAKNTSEDMEIVDRLAIGPKRSIMVVRIGARLLVVGNTETEISLLSEFSADDDGSTDWTQLAE